MAFTKTAGVEYGTPEVVLSTTAAAGSNQTAIRSDGQLIAFDAVVPANISDSAGATGSAALASRRDHVHFSAGAGGDVAGPGSSVDNEIARFSGTTGKVVQAYTSDGPTVSDDGILTLASAQLKFAAAGGASGDANTIDFFEEGVWTPDLQDQSGNSATYNANEGKYTRLANICWVNCVISVATLGTMTTTQAAQIHGLPFTAANDAAGGHSLAGAFWCYYGTNLALSTAGGYVTSDPEPNATYMHMREWSSTEGVSNPLLVSEVSADGVLNMAGFFRI
jgi:hypothetical protein